MNRGDGSIYMRCGRHWPRDSRGRASLRRRYSRSCGTPTTLKHYTDLRLHDAAAAIEALPVPRAAHAQRAGCLDAAGQCGEGQELAGEAGLPATITAQQNTLSRAVLRDSVHASGDVVQGCTKAGDGIRTRDIQLGKLTLYH